MSRSKERKFMPSNQHKEQAKGTTSNKGDNQRRNPANIGNKRGDMKDQRCHNYRKFDHFHAVCRDNKVSSKENHVCDTDQMLEGGFVPKASSLRPRPSLLYLEAQINRRNVSYLVDTRATHFFVSPKLSKVLSLPTHGAGKPINVRLQNASHTKQKRWGCM